MKSDKYKYKLYLKQIQVQNKEEINSDLLNNLLLKDSNSFWKSWKSKFEKGMSPAQTINGSDDEVLVANSFAEIFSEACKPNSATFFKEKEIKFTTENSIPNARAVKAP